MFCVIAAVTGCVNDAKRMASFFALPNDTRDRREPKNINGMIATGARRAIRVGRGPALAIGENVMMDRSLLLDGATGRAYRFSVQNATREV